MENMELLKVVKEMMDANLKEMKARLEAKTDANQAILAKMNDKMDDCLEEGEGGQER
jgi:uncharacterized protein with von Willebrand factor type A (vWA) domain